MRSASEGVRPETVLYLLWVLLLRLNRPLPLQDSLRVVARSEGTTRLSRVEGALHRGFVGRLQSSRLDSASLGQSSWVRSVRLALDGWLR